MGAIRHSGIGLADCIPHHMEGASFFRKDHMVHCTVPLLRHVDSSR